MSRWAIQIPHRRPNDGLQAIYAAARELPAEDRAVTEALVDRLMLIRPRITAAGIVASLEAFSPADRREAIDYLRADAGLPSTEEVNQMEKLRQQTPAPVPISVCAEHECRHYAADQHGIPLELPDRKWWCDEHRHLAGPDDHKPPEQTHVFDPRTMSLVAVGAQKEKEEAAEALAVAEAERAYGTRYKDADRDHPHGLPALGPPVV